MPEPSANPDTADVVVLLGTAWRSLEHHSTRWRAVVQQWAGDSRIAGVRVVDYPGMSVRNVLAPLAVALDSWDPRVHAITGRIPLWRRRTPLDPLAWRAAGRALSSLLAPTNRPRVLLAATPLWAPVMRHVAADRRGFDAVDDWRALPAVARVRDHVVAGYHAAARSDSASAVSEVLADRLGHDFGIAAMPIPNGVDLARFHATASPPPPGAPAGAFAVYIGVVQERVDLDLLRAANRVLPVVVAGPASESTAATLIGDGITYLGAVREPAVTALLQSASVGLIPHHVNPLTTSMDPMKLREYLAAGLPVVTTADAPASAGTTRVIVATDAPRFAEAVEFARSLGPLHRPDPDVAHRTWTAVADELFEHHIAPANRA
jgi:glycosyltransferase involved in cell wall biosynthesis